MTTETHTFEGELLWPRIFAPDEWNGVRMFKTMLVTDQENYDKFMEAGIRTKVKEEDDKFILLFKRPEEAREMPNGTMLGGGRPLLVDSDGEPWPEDGGLVGNGSYAKVTVSVYDTKMGKGHRLDKIQVLKHVKYEVPKEEEVPVKTGDKKVPF